MARRRTSLLAILGALLTLPSIVFLLWDGRSSSPDDVAKPHGGRGCEHGGGLTEPGARSRSVGKDLVHGARDDEALFDGAWGRFSSQNVPTLVDEVHLLVTFGWAIDEVLARFTAGSPLAGEELLDGLLDIEPDNEATGGAEIALACLEGVGIGDEESATRLFQWADRDSARQLFRPIGRVLIGQGERGEELAAELAMNQWERAFQNPSDKVAFLCADYIVHDLKEARATGAVPTLQAMADRAITRASELGVSLEDRADERLKELAAEGDREKARVKWRQDVTSDEVNEMWAWRNRGVEVMEALVTIDSLEVADWVEVVLHEQTSDQLDWKGDALISALYNVLPENPDGEVAKRLKPWVMERLVSDLPETAWEKPVLYRVAGVYGEEAVPALVQALSSQAKHGSVTVESAASLAQAVVDSEGSTGIATLREFMRGERSLAGAGETSLGAYRLVLQAMSEKGTEEDRRWIRHRIAEDPPQQVAMMLELLPDSVWEDRPEDLVAILERMEAFLLADAAASVTVDLALERLLRTSDDPRALVAHLAGSRSPRLAQKCSAAIWRWSMDREQTLDGKLALLRQRFHESENPFRRMQDGPSLWDAALAVARDPDAPSESVVTELGRGDCPLGMRVALCRALALRGTDEDLTVLKTAVPDLVDACRDSVEDGVSWGRRFELGQWKSIAWMAVCGPQGRAVARTAVNRLLPDGRKIPSTLDDRLPLLVAYLEAMTSSGEGVHEKRLEELAELWNQGDNRLDVLESVRAFCFAASVEYLEALVLRTEIPIAVRSEVLLSLFRGQGTPRESVRSLASELYATAWRGAEQEAVEASITHLVDTAPEGRKILLGVLADLVEGADPGHEAALTILARTLDVSDTVGAGEPARANR